MDLDFVSVHKSAKRELGKYPAILTSRLVNNMDSNIPANPAYGVYISQLVRYARICTSKVDFMNRLRGLSLRLRQQGFLTTLLQRTFTKFFNRHVWRGILDKIVIRSCAVRHFIVLHGYVAGDTISYPICFLTVMAMPLCRTTCCYTVPDAAI